MGNTDRDDLLPDVDDIRGIRGEMGLTRFRVFVQTQAWTGGRPGVGKLTATVEKEMLVGGYPPKVRQILGKDVVAGQQEWKNQHLQIGPVTPEFYDNGGVSPGQEDPQLVAGQTIVYRITGPNLPPNGGLYARVVSDESKPFRYMITVRSISRRSP